MTKKLKIGVNMRMLLPGRMEGISRYIYETTRRIVASNPDHHFYFFFDRPFDQKYVFSKNVTPVIVSPKARHPWLWYYWFEHRLAKCFKQYNIDVFYSGESYLSQRAKVPTLIVSHDLAFEAYPSHLPGYQQKYLAKNSIKFHQRADRIIAVSEFTKQDIIKRYNIPAQKIKVAGNAVPDGFKPVSNEVRSAIQNKYSKGKPFILYVGSIHPRKNVLSIIDGFLDFKKKYRLDHNLLLVGRMAWKSKEIENRISVSQEVIHLPHIESDLSNIMASAESLCYISLFEGFGIPILEAMKSEIPVITSKDSSMSEVGGEAVITVDPLNINEISAAMFEVSSNEKLVEELKAKGKRRVEFYSWDKTANLIMQELESLALS